MLFLSFPQTPAYLILFWLMRFRFVSNSLPIHKLQSHRGLVMRTSHFLMYVYIILFIIWRSARTHKAGVGIFADSLAAFKRLHCNNTHKRTTQIHWENPSISIPPTVLETFARSHSHILLLGVHFLDNDWTSMKIKCYVVISWYFIWIYQSSFFFHYYYIFFIFLIIIGIIRSYIRYMKNK